MILHHPHPSPTDSGAIKLLEALTPRKPRVSATVEAGVDGYYATFAARFFGDPWNAETRELCRIAWDVVCRGLPVSLATRPRSNRGTQLPPLDWSRFTECLGREPHVRLLYDCLGNYQHALLYGAPSAGKSVLLRGFAKLVPSLTLAMNATTVAGFMEKARRAVAEGVRLFILEEVEKAKPSVSECLLGLMDDRRVLERVTYRSVDTTDCHVSVFGTCNDIAKLDKRVPAIASRFALRLPCSTPDRDQMYRLLVVAGAEPNWAQEVLRTFWDQRGLRDARWFKAAMSGAGRGAAWLQDFALAQGWLP